MWDRRQRIGADPTAHLNGWCVVDFSARDGVDVAFFRDARKGRVRHNLLISNQQIYVPFSKNGSSYAEEAVPSPKKRDGFSTIRPSLPPAPTCESTWP